MYNIFSSYKNCLTAIFMSDIHLTIHFQIKYSKMFYYTHTHTPLLLPYSFTKVIFRYSPINNHVSSKSIYTCIAQLQWVWRFPKHFSHSFWFHQNFVIFFIVGLLWTIESKSLNCYQSVMAKIQVNRETRLKNQYLASHLSVIRGCLLRDF